MDRTKVVDVIRTITNLKSSWAVHIKRRTDGRWTKRIMDRRPPYTRSRSRPPERWMKITGSKSRRPTFSTVVRYNGPFI